MHARAHVHTGTGCKVHHARERSTRSRESIILIYRILDPIYRTTLVRKCINTGAFLHASLPYPTGQLHPHGSPFAISPPEPHLSGTSLQTWVSTQRTRRYVPPRRQSAVYCLIGAIYRGFLRPCSRGRVAGQTPLRIHATPTYRTANFDLTRAQRCLRVFTGPQ